jgi:hypothetical protein
MMVSFIDGNKRCNRKKLQRVQSDHCNFFEKQNNSPFLNFYFKGEASHISLRWWSFHVQDNFVIMTSDALVFCKYRE